MIVQQTQNAFNDKAAQFILIPLGGAVGASIFGIGIETIAGALIALPFVLFAPLTGWLSDRFSKRNVMLGAAIAQLFILAWLYFSIRMENMHLALFGFFALAVQSAFYGPAKIGINKELVGSRHLGFASGIQQMMTMLAILAGQIGAGIIYDKRFTAAGGEAEHAWSAGSIPLLVLTALAIPAIFMAWVIPRTPAQGASPLKPSVAFQHFRHLGDLWRDRPMRHAALGIAFFWGFVALINIWSIKVAKVLTAGGEGFGSLQAYFMVAASLGMVLGFATTSFLLRKRIELGWVPLAGVAMAIGSVLLSLVDPTSSLRLLEATGWQATLGAIFNPATGKFLWGLTLLAFFSALFLAPLNAWIQDRYPADKRGELQAAVNLQDCFAGILALAFVELFALAFSSSVGPLGALRMELTIVGIASAVVTWFIIRLLPQHFVRVIGLSILSVFYRIRSVGAANVPEKGGVLLLPNHVSWADAFYLTAASPRPVRFVMDAIYMEKPAIAWFCRIFETVPIALDKPREAMRTASAALAQGDVVCLFPEGQLTRTGTLQELKRGFEIIARQAGAPIVPVWLDGVWGSIFSFERNRYFRKRPHRIPFDLSISFGEPIEPKQASLASIRHGIRKAASQAVEARLPKRSKGIDPRHFANGYQLGQINALLRRHSFSVLQDDPDIDPLGGLSLFSKLFKSRINTQLSPLDGQDSHWVGGSTLRDQILSAKAPSREHLFFDFSPQALEALDRPHWRHLPCLAIDGTIVAMSLPDPPQVGQSCRKQAGSKPGTYGHLLPGFDYSESEGITTLHGPAAGPNGLALPAHLTVDSEGFVSPLTS